MNFLKKIRKSLKSSFPYELLKNYFPKVNYSFSETYGEDLFVNFFFKDLKKGFYVDIGCNLPKSGSLTYSLYKKGWNGIKVDISKRSIELNKIHRKRDINLNVSVGKDEKEVDSFIFYDNCSMNTVNKKFSKYTEESVNKKPTIYKIPQKNLAVELLQKLINDEIKTKFRTNIVKQKRFSELLKASLNKYENRAIEAAQVIEELIEMAKKFREDLERGIALGLSSAERSFYDALAENPSAQKLMEEKVLANMAKELAEIIRRDANIDWQYKDNVRAKLRIKIKTLLKRYKYPPDEQVTAVETVLQQAETLGEELVAS